MSVDTVKGSYAKVTQVKPMPRTATQAPDAVVIDASGSHPEQDDECLARHAEVFLRLLLLRQPDNKEALRAFLASPEVRRNAEAVTRRCEELRRQHDECLRELSASGWFLDPATPVKQLRFLRDSLEARGSFEMSAIRLYYLERIDSIQRELLQAYPSRQCVLHDAFEAHRAKRYTLAILGFLAQADGIWQDRLGSSFFLAKERATTLQKCLNDIQLGYVVTLLNVLEQKNALWATAAERSSSFSALNRHQVLHGESVCYGTEENSLKAISLLDCFRALCRRLASH